MPVLATTPIAGSRCGAIVMVKPAEHRYADDTCRISSRFEHALHGNSLPNSLMRPREVEVAEAALPDYSLEVALAQDDHVIEALAADAPKESFAHGVHERSSHGRPKNAHAGVLCGALEVGAELAVVVANDQLRCHAEGRGL